MADEKRSTITHQFLQVVQISEDSRLDRILVPVLMGLGIIYAALQTLHGNWLPAIITAVCVVALVALAGYKPLQVRVLGRAFNRRHASYVALLWVYGLLWLTMVGLLSITPSTGKGSQFFYVLVILFVALNLRLICTALMLTRWGYNLFITAIPIWEQILVAINEAVAAGLFAYVAGGLLAQILQPRIFTLRLDPVYSAGLLAVTGLYYLGMEVMWLQRGNNWLSRKDVWVDLARLLAPLALIVVSLEIYKRFTRLADARTANLLGTRDLDLAVLALSPIVWLMIALIAYMVYTSNQGLRERFLPDELLDLLPTGLKRGLSTISDMDMLLILGLLSTAIPAHLFLLDDQQVGIIDTLRQQILQRGSALIETSEQALALLFTMPFYVLILLLLILYAYAISRTSLSAQKRNELVEKLPNGFLIILIITLYLCAIPFTQVLTEGRLPRLPQDLGRILAFDILIPLVLLYAHYFLLVRIPYGRGQARWRERTQASLKAQLVTTESSIAFLTDKIKQLDHDWHSISIAENVTESAAALQKRLDILYRYVEINSERDTLNMSRLRLISEVQELNEGELEIPLAIARLPTRVVQYGIPLLLAIQIYQWAILNDGLRDLANNPNINIFQFFQTILKQTQF
jgi:hypothetical protein